jgi:acetyl-CoA acetyltransferase
MPASSHPYHDVAITGVYNTEQARVLEGESSFSIAYKGALGALDDAGLGIRDLDGIVGSVAFDLAYQARLAPVWTAVSWQGIPAVLQAAGAIACGLATRVLIVDGAAAVYTDRAATAPWTRPTSEFVAPYGMFTASEFALIARRHMHVYGTKPEALATVASVIRNNGHVNPDAIYSGRGPFTPQDILDSRMVADPFHLLDCATASEGGCGIVLTRADLAAESPQRPVYVLGGNNDTAGPSYKNPPTWELGGNRRPDLVNGTLGRRAAEDAFRTAGLRHDDVDVCEFYDPFSFEIIRQFEAFGFCGEGEGGDFVTDGTIEPTGRFPITTDGGLMSYSHAGAACQMLQRVIRAVEQLRGTCRSTQIDGAEVAMCSNGGPGALFTDVMLLGVDRP